MAREYSVEERKAIGERLKAGRAAKQAAPANETAETQAEEPKPKAKPLKTRKRKRLDGMNLKMQAATRPGFARRWVNDSNEGARLQHFRENLAYDHVHDKNGEPTVKSVGGGTKAYLMETPIEEFEAGKRDKAEHLDKMDESLRRGLSDAGSLKDQGGQFYGESKVDRDA